MDKKVIFYWIFKNFNYSYSIISRANLVISAELGQRAALGRACGNLANAFYLLGNFEEAIVYHKQVIISWKPELIWILQIKQNADSLQWTSLE